MSLKRRYTAHVACKGGCGKTLVTALRLGNPKTRRKYAGWCSDCMTPEMRRNMETDSTSAMLGRLS